MVILMNLQYAPALLDENEQAKPATRQMLDLICGRCGEIKYWSFPSVRNQ